MGEGSEVDEIKREGQGGWKMRGNEGGRGGGGRGVGKNSGKRKLGEGEEGGFVAGLVSEAGRV